MSDKKRRKFVFDMFCLAVISFPLGGLIGVFETIFGRVLILISDFRSQYVFFLVPFLALGGLIIVFCYQKFGGAAGKGMGLVLDCANEKEDKIPLRLIPMVIGSTWLTHLLGGSAGREGVGVQVGGTIAHFVGRKLPIRNAGTILVVAGMSAGFAGLFRTPMAAVFFGLELACVGKLRYISLLPALIASFTASGTSRLLGLEKFAVNLDYTFDFSADTVIKVIIAGLMFGVAGMLFTWALKTFKKYMPKIFPNPYIRVGVVGVALSIVLLVAWGGRYCGLGTNLISAAVNGGTIYPWDWILKILLTTVTLSVGFQGGEVTPLFSIGASLGVVLGMLFGLPLPLMAALGYIAVFGAATNTLLAPIFIGIEAFGGTNVIYFVIVAVIAFAINNNWSIYGNMKQSFFKFKADRAVAGAENSIKGGEDDRQN